MEKLVDKRITAPRKNSAMDKILFIPYLPRSASAKLPLVPCANSHGTAMISQSGGLTINSWHPETLRTLNLNIYAQPPAGVLGIPYKEACHAQILAGMYGRASSPYHQFVEFVAVFL